MLKRDQPPCSPNQMISEAVVHLTIKNTKNLAILSKLKLFQRDICRRRSEFEGGIRGAWPYAISI